jgi:hypothetical protein
MMLWFFSIKSAEVPHGQPLPVMKCKFSILDSDVVSRLWFHLIRLEMLHESLYSPIYAFFIDYVSSEKVGKLVTNHQQIHRFFCLSELVCHALFAKSHEMPAFLAIPSALLSKVLGSLRCVLGLRRCVCGGAGQPSFLDSGSKSFV